jgi:hypothetical protein
MSRAFVFCAALLATGCSYPVEQVRQADERPAILIEGAPIGAALIIDGMNVGTTNGSNGQPRAVRVESGTHKVEVDAAGRVLMDQRVFVSGSAIKTFVVSGGTTH